MEPQTMLKIWRNYFNQLLNRDDDQNPASEQPSEANLVDYLEIHPPDLSEIRLAMARIKSNKAAGSDGLQVDLFRYAEDDLIRSIHELGTFLGTIHKKGNRLLCSNYRGISLLNIACKILSSVLCERLKPFTDEQIGLYQCGLRPEKSTIDQIFKLRQILEKAQKFNNDTHQLFIDFKAAYDSVNREGLYRTMTSFGNLPN